MAVCPFGDEHDIKAQATLAKAHEKQHQDALPCYTADSYPKRSNTGMDRSAGFIEVSSVFVSPRLKPAIASTSF